MYEAGFWSWLGIIVLSLAFLGWLGMGIQAIFEEIREYYEKVGSEKFWKRFWFILGDIVVGALIFLFLFGGLVALSMFGAVFLIGILCRGLVEIVIEGFAESNYEVSLIFAFVFKVIYKLAIILILLSPFIGIVLFIFK